MKQPDYTNFQPIDKLKIVLGSVMNIQCKDEILTCYINPNKLDLDEIDQLSFYQQEHYEVKLDRVINREKFIESKFKDGIEEITVKLKDIGDMTIAR
ncbi:hypothetical protein [Chryseobacterium oncorhynchi]|uniref:Uncharacterized protein n=1 Tax=Chryseobacterium oncorhynchi TaxID=741074 RepID=A0A316WEW7_9FLAO|nr:hypothetical protein [Chryseobacterium oncorhynchi]PWN60005.1 hypothetical protein C1638_020785 [Chryseobacterium oncorhynchi]